VGYIIWTCFGLCAVVLIRSGALLGLFIWRGFKCVVSFVRFCRLRILCFGISNCCFAVGGYGWFCDGVDFLVRASVLKLRPWFYGVRALGLSDGSVDVSGVCCWCVCWGSDGRCRGVGLAGCVCVDVGRLLACVLNFLGFLLGRESFIVYGR